MSLFDIANAGFAAQDTIKAQNRERQNFNANVAFKIRLLQKWLLYLECLTIVVR